MRKVGYPKQHKILKGWDLFRKKNKVKIIVFNEEQVQAYVNGSSGEHFATIENGFYRCTCHDWVNRWRLVEGAYLCQHLEDLKFEIMYRLMNNLEMIG